MNLLLIHGIAQGGKNWKDLERAWLGALDKGLKKSGLTMPANVNVLIPDATKLAERLSAPSVQPERLGFSAYEQSRKEDGSELGVVFCRFVLPPL
jgi:hypothetical protein